MDTVRARKLRAYERKNLDRMKRQLTNQVNSRHARIILLSREGVCNREIAAQVDCTPQWVRVIIHRFNDRGIEGIQSHPRPSSPRKFLADVREQIAAVALSPPRILIAMNQWSLAKLRQYLIEQKIIAAISLSWLRFLLREAGVRWRHTKARGGKVDRLRATYHRHGGVRHMFGMYDLETDRLWGVFAARKTWTDFLGFLKWVRRRYPLRETLHVVLDNYSPHLKTEVLQWAAAHGVQFCFTPTNASWLNRIECQFAALRKFALDNSDFRTHEEQQQAITGYLAWRNARRTISDTSWQKYRRRQTSSKPRERLAA